MTEENKEPLFIPCQCCGYLLPPSEILDGLCYECEKAFNTIVPPL